MHYAAFFFLVDFLACADRSAEHWQKAHASVRERAIAIKLRGIGHQLKGDHAAAIATYREALKLHRGLSAESMDVATTLNDLGTVEQNSGDLDAAERDYREALRVARAVDYREGVAVFTGNIAKLTLYREDWTGAETLARDALTLSENLGRQQVIALTCWCLAKALVRQGKRDAALPFAQRSLNIYTQLGMVPDIEAARAMLEQCAG